MSLNGMGLFLTLTEPLYHNVYGKLSYKHIYSKKLTKRQPPKRLTALYRIENGAKLGGAVVLF